MPVHGARKSLDSWSFPVPLPFPVFPPQEKSLPAPSSSDTNLGIILVLTTPCFPPICLPPSPLRSPCRGWPAGTTSIGSLCVCLLHSQPGRQQEITRGWREVERSVNSFPGSTPQRESPRILAWLKPPLKVAAPFKAALSFTVPVTSPCPEPFRPPC